uniref:Uncharacterized protein n=1 Tax=Cacopsylla melanoneura TaxID=428564 RepID=A0A8D8Z7C5_9HEMI
MFIFSLLLLLLSFFHLLFFLPLNFFLSFFFFILFLSVLFLPSPLCCFFLLFLVLHNRTSLSSLSYVVSYFSSIFLFFICASSSFFYILYMYVWISSLVLPNLSSQLHSSPLLAEYYSLFSQIISFPFSVMSLSASSKRSRKRSIKKYTDSKNRNDADGSADGYTIERIKDTL